jgi:hypothetical protein
VLAAIAALVLASIAFIKYSLAYADKFNPPAQAYSSTPVYNTTQTNSFSFTNSLKSFFASLFSPKEDITEFNRQPQKTRAEVKKEKEEQRVQKLAQDQRDAEFKEKKQTIEWQYMPYKKDIQISEQLEAASKQTRSASRTDTNVVILRHGYPVSRPVNIPAPARSRSSLGSSLSLSSSK